MKEAPQDVVQYIHQFDPIIQERLNVVRSIVYQVQPECQEKISYGVIGFKHQKGYLYIAAFQKHIGMYPFNENTALRSELEPYFGKGTKASLHFPHNKDLPLDLIRKICEERLI